MCVCPPCVAINRNRDVLWPLDGNSFSGSPWVPLAWWYIVWVSCMEVCLCALCMVTRPALWLYCIIKTLMRNICKQDQSPSLQPLASPSSKKRVPHTQSFSLSLFLTCEQKHTHTHLFSTLTASLLQCLICACASAATLSSHPDSQRVY